MVKRRVEKIADLLLVIYQKMNNNAAMGVGDGGAARPDLRLRGHEPENTGVRNAWARARPKPTSN
jgi:hypothetical protein